MIDKSSRQAVWQLTNWVSHVLRWFENVFGGMPDSHVVEKLARDFAESGHELHGKPLVWNEPLPENNNQATEISKNLYLAFELCVNHHTGEMLAIHWHLKKVSLPVISSHLIRAVTFATYILHQNGHRNCKEISWSLSLNYEPLIFFGTWICWQLLTPAMH